MNMIMILTPQLRERLGGREGYGNDGDEESGRGKSRKSSS